MNKFMDYFKRAYGVNLCGEVTWSHAVNSLDKLEEVINDPDIMFIESDILTSSSGDIVAAHSREDNSDLSLKQLLRRLKDLKKGIKLDFKDPQSVAPALWELTDLGLECPVILNADILTGNGAQASKFDAADFIVQCKRQYPDALLSLGWTTVADPSFPYNDKNIDEMLAIVRDLKAVTFPVRACLLPGSWDNLSKLLDNNERTFSIWNNEPVDEELKEWIQNSTDPTKTFYDFIDENKNSLKLW